MEGGDGGAIKDFDDDFAYLLKTHFSAEGKFIGVSVRSELLPLWIVKN